MNDSGLDWDRLNKARDTAEEKVPGAIRAAAKMPGKLGDDARSYVEGERISANMQELGDQALRNTTRQAMAGIETERLAAGGAGGLRKVPGGAPLGSLGKPQRERAEPKRKGLDMA